MHGSIKKKKTPVYATLKDQMAIADLLKTHLHRDGLLWFYDPGWNDEQIAAVVNPDLNSTHVRNIRLELFGPTRKPPTPRTDISTEERITKLEDDLRELRDAYLKLSEALGI